MRFINYDKLHCAIYNKLIEYTPPSLRNDYMRGYADGLHWALHVIECQDNRKKLLQPERSEFDWSIVNAMLGGLSDMLPDTNKAHGGGWLQDWLKNFMLENSIDPAYLLMEEKERKHGA